MSNNTVKPNALPEPVELGEGDRVRLIADKGETGTIDEVWKVGEIGYASVVWDSSGCMGDGPWSDLERVP